MAIVVSAVTAALVEGATLAVIATAVSEVGIALSVVGAITGNKDLMKIGGFLGLAGGIGSLASAGMDALGTSAVSAAVDETGAETARLAAGEATASASESGRSNSASQDAVASSVDGPTNAALAADSAAPAMPPPMASPAPVVTAPTVDALPGAPPGSYAAPQTPAAQDIGAVDTANGSTGAADPYANETAKLAQQNSIGGGTPGAPPAGSTFDSIKNWYNSQKPEVQAAILKGGASAVGGLFQGWTEEQKLALEKNRFALTQQQYNTSVTNANAQPKIAFQTPGIINTTRGY